MRRLLVALLVLGVLAVAVDRVVLVVVQRSVATDLQASGELSAPPTVRIAGFPFLTQAARGRYDRVEVRTALQERGGVRVERLDVVATDAEVRASEALRNGVTRVPVSGLTATGLVTYADLVGDRGLVVTPVAGGVRVTGSVTVLGQRLSASATSDVRLDGSTIVVTARTVEAGGVQVPAGLLDLRVPVGRLPYGLRLTGLSARADGLALAARSGPTVLEAP